MIYELRMYKIPEGRMPDILNRFETVTIDIFKKYGIETVGFWTRADANELVYLCRFESQEAMKKAWTEFQADPGWIEAKERTTANGPIVDEVVSHTLIPASFSAMQ